MPSARAELEAALRQRIDRDVLSVYADVLQAEGDARGEQIALELGTADADRFARFELWLRAELAQRAGEVAHPHLIVVDRRDAEWLATPLGEFARGASVVARAPEVREVLAAIAARPRPYFRRAKLLAGFETVVLSDELVAATPNLEELELEGGFDLGEFVHPALRTLRRSIRSTEGGAALLRPLYLPAVTHLELNPWPDAVPEARFTCEHLPALVALDLVRCEPKYGRYDGFHMLDVCGWLRSVPWLGQLRKVRLPSLRTQRAADDIAAILGANSQLAVTVARAYTRCSFGAELAPRVTLPLARPWIPEDMVTKDTWDVTFDFGRGPGGRFKVIVSAVSGRLERLDYAGFAPELRADWERVCTALDAAAARGKKTRLPCALLVRTLGTFTSGSEYDTATDIGKHVIAAAQRVTPDDLVTIQK